MLAKRRGRFLVQILVFAMAFAVIGISNVVADSGWFAGVTIGQTKWKDYDAELAAAATSLDDSDTGVFAFGGYQVNNYFSALAGFADLGTLTAMGDFGEGYSFEDRISADGPVVAAVGTVPINSKLSAFAILGMMFWDQKIEYYDDFIGPWNGGVSGNSMMYGVGANLWVGPSKSSGIHMAYMMFDSIGDLNDPESTHENDVEMISVGYIYRWGL